MKEMDQEYSPQNQMKYVYALIPNWAKTKNIFDIINCMEDHSILLWGDIEKVFSMM